MQNRVAMGWSVLYKKRSFKRRRRGDKQLRRFQLRSEGLIETRCRTENEAFFFLLKIVSAMEFGPRIPELIPYEIDSGRKNAAGHLSYKLRPRFRPSGSHRYIFFLDGKQQQNTKREILFSFQMIFISKAFHSLFLSLEASPQLKFSIFAVNSSVVRWTEME